MQLTPKNKTMDCEVHITAVERTLDSPAHAAVVSVVADGFLYVDGLRVYEARNLRLDIIDDDTDDTDDHDGVHVGDRLAEAVACSVDRRWADAAAPPRALDGTRARCAEVDVREVGALRSCLLDLARRVTVIGADRDLTVSVPALCARDLGDPSFLRHYGCSYALYVMRAPACT